MPAQVPVHTAPVQPVPKAPWQVGGVPGGGAAASVEKTVTENKTEQGSETEPEENSKEAKELTLGCRRCNVCRQIAYAGKGLCMNTNCDARPCLATFFLTITILIPPLQLLRCSLKLLLNSWVIPSYTISAQALYQTESDRKRKKTNKGAKRNVWFHEHKKRKKDWEDWQDWNGDSGSSGSHGWRWAWVG